MKPEDMVVVDLDGRVGKGVLFWGTTHADHFYGDIPVPRPLTDGEISEAYEKETGTVMIETFRERRIGPKEVSAVLVQNTAHSPGGMALNFY